jgi:hypothetical protein
MTSVSEIVEPTLLVLQALWITVEDHNQLVYEHGMRYLVKTDRTPHMIELFESSPEFWDDWKYYWMKRDHQFITDIRNRNLLNNAIISRSRGQALMEEYLGVHDIYKLKHIPTVASLKLIEERVKSEV